MTSINIEMTTPLKCAGCHNLLPKREFLQCTMCKAKYDIECANISSKSFRTMERKDVWKCPECTSKRPKKGNVNTPVRNTASPEHGGGDYVANLCVATKDASDGQNVTLRRQHRKTSFSDTDTPTTVHDNDGHPSATLYNNMLDDLKQFMRELVHTQMESIREAINDLTHAIKAQNTRIDQLEARVSSLESKAEEARQPDQTSASSIGNVVAQLQADIAERDQALLSNDLEIAGCSEAAGENCAHIVLAIAKKIGVELDERDIVSVGRAGPSRLTSHDGAPARPRPIALRLARRATRDAVLQAARTRRDLNTTGLRLPEPTRPIYINERLTKHNRLLFRKARTIARELQYKYVWTREGNVFVRQEEGKVRHRLRTDMDLLKVFGKCHI